MPQEPDSDGPTLVNGSTSHNMVQDEEISAPEMNKAIELVKKLKSDIASVGMSVQNLISNIEDGVYNFEHGISFLDVKNVMLQGYITDLLNIVGLKLDGQSIAEHPCRDRLIQRRVFLERMKPIGTQLKYQIDKLISLASSEDTGKDPLRFKPNIGDLESDDQEEEDEETEEQEEGDKKEKTKKGLYVPPKIAARAMSDKLMSVKEKNERALARARQRAVNSSLLEEMLPEITDAPIEEREEGYGAKRKFERMMKERERYEEENFLRLPTTKELKHQERLLREKRTGVEDLTQFESINALQINDPDEFNITSKKRRPGKGPSKKKGKGKGKGSKLKNKFKRRQ